MNHVAREKKHYTAAHILPSGEPQVPPTLASTHCAFQESDSSWWFLPKTDPRVTKSRQPVSPVVKEAEAAKQLEVMNEAKHFGSRPGLLRAPARTL